jgi:dUTP pyrophosphatase
MKIYVKKVDGVSLPQKGTEVAAGYDIVATSEPKIVGEPSVLPMTYKRIDYIEYETNLFIAPSAFTFHTLIHPRSSVSKYNLVLANSIGLIDNDYRGMVICRFKYQWQPEDFVMEFAKGNFTDEYARPTGVMSGKVNMEKIYKKGDKIAQLVVEQTVGVEWELVDDLAQTQRGAGGFGSTDRVGVSTYGGNIQGGRSSDVITIAKSNKSILPKEVAEREHKESGSTLTELYQKTGGIPIKERYMDEIKNRNTP